MLKSTREYNKIGVAVWDNMIKVPVVILKSIVSQELNIFLSFLLLVKASYIPHLNKIILHPKPVVNMVCANHNNNVRFGRSEKSETTILKRRSIRT
jgi:hypothetical protein